MHDKRRRPCTLIDTHCHLNETAFAASAAQAVERAAAAGVSRMIVPAYDRESFNRTAAVAARFPGVVFPAFGIHPWYAEDGIACIDDVRLFLTKEKAVAVGEIGIDLAPGMPPEDLQRQVLVEQLDLALDLGLPVTLHCRRAQEQLLRMLKGYAGRIGGVLHSFSGSADQMARFLDLGFSIGFSGSVTRETARKYHKNAALVPLDRLLVETDAPSIATRTTHASEVEPAHTREVAEAIARVRGIPFDEVCAASTANAVRLFPLVGGRP
jgi:TatD DNase family protein